jgi:Leucine-rich repeat (LRR) protein
LEIESSTVNSQRLIIYHSPNRFKLEKKVDEVEEKEEEEEEEEEHDEEEPSFPDGFPTDISIPDDWSGLSSLPSIHRRDPPPLPMRSTVENADTPPDVAMKRRSKSPPKRRPQSPTKRKSKSPGKRRSKSPRGKPAYDEDTGSLTNLEYQMERITRQVRKMEKKLVSQNVKLKKVESEYQEEKGKMDDLNRQLQETERLLQSKRRRESLMEEEEPIDEEEVERQRKHKEKKKKKQKRKKKAERGKDVDEYDKRQQKKQAHRKKKKSAKRRTQIDYKAMGYRDYEDYRDNAKRRGKRIAPKRRSFSGTETPNIRHGDPTGRDTPMSWPATRKHRASAQDNTGRRTPDWLKEARARQPASSATQPIAAARAKVPAQPTPRVKKRQYWEDFRIEEEEDSVRPFGASSLARMFALPLLMIIIVAVLLVVFLVIVPSTQADNDTETNNNDNNNDNNDNNDNNAPLSPPTSRVKGRSNGGSFDRFLPRETQLLLQDLSSPQGMAYQWLNRDPMLGEYTHNRQLQRFVLAVLFYSLDGINWTEDQGWLLYDIPECDWYSAYSGGSPCPDGLNFEYLILPQNNLRGTVPLEIALLSHLKAINVGENSISGYVPSEIGLLTNLETLHIWDTFVSGPVPSELSQLPHLRECLMHLNRLQQTIPTELGLLESLEKLWLDRNFLTGVIPDEFGSLERLTELMLFDNKLSGGIPSSLGQALSLRRVELAENLLSGEVPPSLCSLFGSPSLQTISIDCSKVFCDCSCHCG